MIHDHRFSNVLNAFYCNHCRNHIKKGTHQKNSLQPNILNKQSPSNGTQKACEIVCHRIQGNRLSECFIVQKIGIQRSANWKIQSPKKTIGDDT